MPPLAGLAEEVGGPFFVPGHAVAGIEEVGQVGAAEGVVPGTAPFEEGGGLDLVHSDSLAVAVEDSKIEAAQRVPLLARAPLAGAAVEVGHMQRVLGRTQALLVEEGEIRAAEAFPRSQARP